MTQTDARSTLAFPVLVVIPCLNEAAYIDGLIAELLAQISDTDSRIVVADGGSTDCTVEIIKAAEAKHDAVTYLHNPKRIQSAAINSAVSKYGADFDFWLRIDAHADYPQDFIATLTKDQDRTGACSIVVPMKTVGKARRQQAIATAQNSRLGNGGSPHRQGDGFKGQWVDHGHHALMRVDCFLEVGGYDESFSHNEDAELDVRLANAGQKIWLTGATSMTYYPRSTFWALAKQYLGYGAGRAQTTIKHRIKLRKRQLVPALLLPLSLPAIFAPLMPILSIPFLFWALSICFVGASTARRNPQTRSISGMLSVSWAIAIIHMAWSAGFCRSFVHQTFSPSTSRAPTI